jgi:hypothetical protein
MNKIRKIILGAAAIFILPSVTTKIYTSYNEISISNERKKLEEERIELERRKLRESR